ncbi:MAG: hypothetical protein QOI71_1289, partial [Gaiellales bacterium]|nr:hypothetical protein [Gaiellales bacterium]
RPLRARPPLGDAVSVGDERTLIALARTLEAALGGWLDPDSG